MRAFSIFTVAMRVADELDAITCDGTGEDCVVPNAANAVPGKHSGNITAIIAIIR